MPRNTESSSRADPVRILIYTFTATVIFLFVWFQLELILLAFAGVLFAVLLRAITSWIQDHTPLNGQLAYAATLLFLIGVIVGMTVLIAPRAIAQLSQIINSMPASIKQIERPFQGTPLGRKLLAGIEHMANSANFGATLSHVASVATSSLADLVVVVVIGFFAALHPRGYWEGVLLLIPGSRRQRAREIALELARQLRWWMIGQMLPMVALGIASSIGLWILGVHLAWTLGIITGIAVFLPYAGTLLAGIPSVLMGLQQGPRMALYVLILYTGLHLMEGYILTPLVQKKAVRLPPVVTILSQFFLWEVGGVLGLAVAAPLASSVLVLVKELYLQEPATRPLDPRYIKAGSGEGEAAEGGASAE